MVPPSWPPQSPRMFEKPASKDFLFAHNHQTRELFTGKANDTNLTGWAGRLADQWSGLHGGNVMGLNVSFRGQVRLMVGSQTQPVLFRPGSAATYSYLTQKLFLLAIQPKTTLQNYFVLDLLPLFLHMWLLI